MDPITLVTTAVAITTPFLIKSGEKLAESIGEDMWNWIKKKFTKKEEEEILINPQDGLEERLSKVLLEKIESNPDLKKELEAALLNIEKTHQSYFQQNITTNGNIEKQVNIQEVTGNITL